MGLKGCRSLIHVHVDPLGLYLGYASHQRSTPMKHIYAILSSAALLSATSLMAQQSSGYNILDMNDVSARFYSNGFIGMDRASGAPDFFVPKTTSNAGPSPLFAAGMWIGGLSPDNNLHFAGERFEQVGRDFFPGPLGTGATITPAVSAQYDMLASANRSDIQAQLAYFDCLADPDCNEQAQFPGYTVPSYFHQWPANGDVSMGQAHDLAPYIDHNGNGIYDPENGDAPCILGDRALYTIYNDRLAAHTESGGLQIGLEIHMMPFVYSSNVQAVNQTIFIHYKIINRGTLTLTNTYIGLFNDFDLGCGNDDYLQCDVGRNLLMVLNGDNSDEDCNGHPGYGAQPPAFGQVILQGPLLDLDGQDNTDTLTDGGYTGTGFNDGVVDNERFGMGRFMGFSNSSGPTSDPNGAGEYYGYLKGNWKDNTPMTYGGSGYSTDPSAVPARYVYPGASDPLGVGTNGQVMPPWTETSAGNPPGDRRGVASMGPFTLEPGQEEEIVVAYVYARAASGGPEASVAALQQRTDSIRAFAHDIPGLLGGGTPCAGLVTGVTPHTVKDLGLRVYPNPANDQIHLVLPSSAARSLISVFDSQGALVFKQEVKGDSKVIDVAHLSPGIYLAQVQTGGKAYSKSFVKE